MQNILAPITLMIAALASSPCDAQTLGYISGYFNDHYTLALFNTATGRLVNSFPDGPGSGTTFAVSSNGSTLYVPGSAGVYPNVTGVLNEVSATMGQVVQSVPLPFPAQQVILFGNGSKAFVMEQADSGNTTVVQAVDLVAGTVLGSIVVPEQNQRFTLDIAVSPNGSEVFVAVDCGNRGYCDHPLPTSCSVKKGLCIYNASTFAFVAEISDLTGFLSVSQDSNSLYVAPPSMQGESLFVVNTQTLAQSKIPLGGLVSGPPVMSPLGEYAVVFVNLGPPQNYSKAVILNTSTNQFVKTLFLSAPGGSGTTSEYFGEFGVYTLAAFASDGQSIWTILGCTPGTDCRPDNAIPSLSGFSFPSGALIADVPLPIEPEFQEYFISLAFPQVVKQ